MYSFSIMNTNSLIKLYTEGCINKLSRLCGLHKSFVKRFLCENGIDTRTQTEQMLLESKINVYNSDYFDVIDSHVKAYWIGFILADGSLSPANRYRLSISLQLSDLYHLEKFSNIFGADVFIDRGYPRCDIECQYLWRSLNNIGIKPQKSFYETGCVFDNIPVKYINSFILGFMDGDGSVLLAQPYPNYYIIELSFCGAMVLMEKLKTALVSKFDLNDNKIGEHNNSFRVGWRGKQVLPVLKWLYKDSPVKLERKYNIYKKYLNKVKKLRRRKHGI